MMEINPEAEIVKAFGFSFVLNRWRGSRRKWQLKEKYEKRQKNEDICPFGI